MGRVTEEVWNALVDLKSTRDNVREAVKVLHKQEDEAMNRAVNAWKDAGLPMHRGVTILGPNGKTFRVCLTKEFLSVDASPPPDFFTVGMDKQT